MVKPVPNDSELWDAFRKGDREAFEQLYRLFAKPLLRYGLKIAPDRDLVLDAIQDMFVYLSEHHASLGPAASVQFYLYKALRRVIIKKIQKEANYTTDDDIESWMEVTLPAEADWIKNQTETDRVRHLAACMAQLPNRQREALHLHYMEGIPVNQVAELMGIRVHSVYKFIYKAMDHLRKKLNPELLWTFLLVLSGW